MPSPTAKNAISLGSATAVGAVIATKSVALYMNAVNVKKNTVKAAKDALMYVKDAAKTSVLNVAILQRGVTASVCCAAGVASLETVPNATLDFV